jgi:hypothetical protein
MPVVKTRKDHKCDACGIIIKKGDKAFYWEAKTARFAEGDFDGKQIGVEYHKGWVHIEGDPRCKYEH